MSTTSYYSLEALASELGLPKTYLRKMAKQNKIPHLAVRGRLRFNPEQVQIALDRLAAGEGASDE